MPVAPHARQRGIALIESLVASMVLALGLLGILQVQIRTLADTQTAVRRAQAIRLIEDLDERMKVHPNALADLDAYTTAFADTPAPGDCQAQACTHAQLAAYDLGIWKQSVGNALPLGLASVFPAPGESTAPQRRQLGVMIAWRENEQDIADAADRKRHGNPIDATQLRAADGSFSAGGGSLSCPRGYTCHLQYLTAAARCAPYLDAGAARHFCPGA
jgi:type IV pilus assembly protein PilV